MTDQGFSDLATAYITDLAARLELIVTDWVIVKLIGLINVRREVRKHGNLNRNQGT